MREILFKAKRLSDGEWVECSLAGWTVEVDPETVSQFTGLYDKNGSKIFENDILGQMVYVRRDESGKEIYATMHVVVRYGEFNCGCCHRVYGFSFEDCDGELSISIECSDDPNLAVTGNAIIVGNCFDNPELLNP